MNSKNRGYMPNNALYHAEGTSLFRLARAEGGSLRGKEIRMKVDRRLCGSCEKLLALITQELGSPRVTITDGAGRVFMLRDGQFITVHP